MLKVHTAIVWLSKGKPEEGSDM